MTRIAASLRLGKARQKGGRGYGVMLYAGEERDGNDGGMWGEGEGREAKHRSQGKTPQKGGGKRQWLVGLWPTGSPSAEMNPSSSVSAACGSEILSPHADWWVISATCTESVPCEGEGEGESWGGVRREGSVTKQPDD